MLHPSEEREKLKEGAEGRRRERERGEEGGREERDRSFYIDVFSRGEEGKDRLR